jgi:hypothetical protein
MADAGTVLSRLIAALTVSDPQWDTSVGSATYKIFEAVSQEIANASNNTVLQTYSYDISSKFGSELDAFCNLFGINRQLGKRSIGSVVFNTNAPAIQDYDIPLGTQIYVPGMNGNSNIYFTTTSPATLSAGQTSVEVPIVSVLPGSFNNVNANTITANTTPLVGITDLSNGSALSGGTDTETDDQLKQRFRITAFSNFSGTTEKYTALALQNSNISQVNVLGSEEVALEQLQVQTYIVTSGTYVTSRFNVALQNQATLIANSGTTLASGYLGPLALNITIPSSSITTSPATGVLQAGTTVKWDGTNYNLSLAATSGGLININHVVCGTAPVTLSGGSTHTDVQSTISGLLGGGNGSPLAYDSLVGVTVTGTYATLTSGIYVSFSQALPYNLIISSGNTTGAGATISGMNIVTSNIIDSKYVYPQGNEIVGIGLGSFSETVFTNNIDYKYPSSTVPPLKLTLIPGASNSPYTSTGSTLQVQSEYVPSGSRISNPAINSNFIDIYVNGTTVVPTVEQIVLLQNNQFGTSGTTFPSGNYITASGGSPSVGDIYISPSTQPMGNYPAQIVSGNAPSYLQFANYAFPVCMLPPGSRGIAIVSGASGDNILYTTTSVSGWAPGLAIVSGTAAIPIGSYVNYVVPGSPNLIYLNNNLTADLNTTTITGAVVAYPVYDNTNTAGSKLDKGGVAFESTDPVHYPSNVYPASVNGFTGTMEFNYYSDIVEIDDLVQQSRIVGTNALVHQAQFLKLNINLSIVYSNAININSVNTQIQSTISDTLNFVPFAGTLKFNDIIRQVMTVPGVSNCRISTASDNSTNYGVAVLNNDGSVNKRWTTDIPLTNTQLPVLYSINYTAFGSNNF